MKISFPKYYKDFKCIAEKCRHSCCVGWEIEVDAETLSRYRSLEDSFGKEICAHISDGSIELSSDGRCPFLDERGLCRIISRLGEGYISEICRQHPRFYHSVCGLVEGGIGAVCEEACRIILSSDNFDETVELDLDAEASGTTNFDSLSHRKEIFAILCDGGLAYTERLNKIAEKYTLPDLLAYKDSLNDALFTLEYLSEDRRGCFKIGSREDREGVQTVILRYFAYLLYRHASPASSLDNFRARVGFCLLLVLVLENLCSHKELSFDMLSELARVISEEIEYSEDNTDALIFELESLLI